jgi:hypothetical protein
VKNGRIRVHGGLGKKQVPISKITKAKKRKRKRNIRWNPIMGFYNGMG